MLFNEIHYRNEKYLLNFDNSNIILRNAVRAIIIDENKLLMAYLEKLMNINSPAVVKMRMKQ